jgi:hypothetical protein
VQTLYVYRDAYATPPIEGAFWLHDFPPIDHICMPDRWTGWKKEWMIDGIQSAFPSISICQTSWNLPASGDPYLFITEDTARNHLIDWQMEIRRLATPPTPPSRTAPAVVFSGSRY